MKQKNSDEYNRLNFIQPNLLQLDLEQNIKRDVREKIVQNCALSAKFHGRSWLKPYL